MEHTIFKLATTNKSKYLYRYLPQLFLFSEHYLLKIIPTLATLELLLYLSGLHQIKSHCNY